MFNKPSKLEKLLEITNITDDELAKLDYKQKSAYYKAKCQIGNLVFKSRDENGKGLTYKKNKKN